MRINRFEIVLLFLIAMMIAAGSVSAQTAGSAIIARDEPAEGGGGAPGSSQGFGGSAGTARSATHSSAKKTTTTKKAVAKMTAVPKLRPWNGFTVGDKYTFLNFEVVSAEKPWHTREAKANGASGLVQVEVLIDTNGRVIQAKGRTGNKILHLEAERAALASTFNRPTFGGKSARAIGFLVYRFGPAED
jgi:hypothetical protein